MKQKKLNTINFNSFKLFNKLFSNWITIKSDVNNLLPFMAETLCAPNFIENLDHRNQTAAHVCVCVALKLGVRHQIIKVRVDADSSRVA